MFEKTWSFEQASLFSQTEYDRKNSEQLQNQPTVTNTIINFPW